MRPLLQSVCRCRAGLLALLRRVHVALMLPRAGLLLRGAGALTGVVRVRCWRVPVWGDLVAWGASVEGSWLALLHVGLQHAC